MAYLFDRSLSSNLQYSHVTGFSGTTRFSVNAWVYVTGATTGYDPIMGQSSASTNGWYCVNFNNDPTSFNFGIRNGATEGGNNVGSGFFILNAWNPVHIVFDGNATGVARGRAWVNGTEFTSWTGTTTNPTSVGAVTTAFEVGTEQSATFWSGRLAELAIWPNLALTNPQVIRAMANGLSAPSAHPVGLVHYMPLSRATGTVDVLTRRDASAKTAVTLVEHPFTQQPFRRRLASQLITSVPSVAWLPVSRVAQGPVTRFAPGGMVPPG
jgi:hypothetical protein